jgi:replicative superfamily II helicase
LPSSSAGTEKVSKCIFLKIQELLGQGHGALNALFPSSADTILSCLLPSASSPTAVKRAQLIEDLVAAAGAGTKFPSWLLPAVRLGIMYHHGGITVEERGIIESAFRSRTILFLFCTTTLAAGVNLPARRVIIHEPKSGRDLIPVSRYHQMTGRAGRFGFDDSGDSILLCSDACEAHGRYLLTAACEPVLSSLESDAGRFLLELICASHSFGRKCVLDGPSNAATTSILQVVADSLWGIQSTPAQIRLSAISALHVLSKRGIIECAEQQQFSPTTKGLAVFRSGISVDDADQLLAELTKANDHLVLSDPLHVIFLLVRGHLRGFSLFLTRDAVPRAASEDSAKTRLEALS